MMKKKILTGALCFTCMTVLILTSPMYVNATEEEETFGAGELEQDDSGEIQGGGEEPAVDTPDVSGGGESQGGADAPAADAPTEETPGRSYLDIKNDEIDAAQKQKENLESGLSDIVKIKEELQNSKYDLNQYVNKLDSNLDEIETKIGRINNLIEEKEQAIVSAKQDLKKAQESEVEQYNSMKKRIKLMYEKGSYSILDIIFGSGSFSEMLNKVEYIQKLSDYDRKKMKEYQETVEYVRLCEQELNVQQETLEEAAEAAKNEQSAMQELITEKNGQIQEYASDISKKEELIEAYEQDIAEQNNTIAELEQAVAAEKKRLAEGGNPSRISYGGGAFAWPCPSYTRISDDYGNRMHPILKVEKFHNGVDLAAPSGSPILAAYEGQVVGASYNTSMGNYIMIDHGDGLYTIYMHCSAVYVSSGDMVAKGATIGAVGSTGRSTGPHLHFSVRLNGNYVSPWKYL